MNIPLQIVNFNNLYANELKYEKNYFMQWG
jgi:hypothetical protein